MRPLDLRDEALAARLLAMQQEAYAIEAAMIGLWEIPPLTESLAELRASHEHFTGYFVGEVLAGAVATERAGDVVEVSRLIVLPAFFRRGIGRALLAHVVAANPDARRLRVATGTLNAPAVALYQGFGFVEQGRREVAPGVWVTHFEKAV
ncbi:MAG: GNAT family N-acetyltransferase [Ktedonobacterales bacterium]|nr:GNAT family N-acetyltransferase [Ktedonobacterales bacterium]